MIVLHLDLDNTVIYSYKKDIGQYKRTVEIYHEREISFITEKTYELLKKVKEKMLVVPTSTRTIEQYERIRLGVGRFPYALVCNGGILLINGERDPEWYKDSLKNIKESRDELDKAIKFLEKDIRRSFELRFIEELFIFTKCEGPDRVVKDLKEKLDISKVDVFHNGTKVYVVPKNLSKGNAVKRFKKYIEADMVIAAGDSEFDISMLLEAHKGLAPYGLCKDFGMDMEWSEAKEGELFSEYVLRECMKIAEAHV